MRVLARSGNDRKLKLRWASHLGEAENVDGGERAGVEPRHAPVRGEDPVHLQARVSSRFYRGAWMRLNTIPTPTYVSI
jgi:hypothetical protein